MHSLEKTVKTFLQQCKLEKSQTTGSNKASSKNSKTRDNVDSNTSTNFKADPRTLLRNIKINTNVVEYSIFNKKAALLCFAEGKELEGICHLVESHGVCVRQQIIQRSTKSKFREQYLNMPQIYGLNSTYVNYEFGEHVWNGEQLTSRLKDLPSEWYMIQMTSQYEPYNYTYRSAYKHPMAEHIRPMHAIHVTVLPTGKDGIEPICITLPAPNTHDVYDILKEIGSVLYHQKSDLQAAYKNTKVYWSMREKQNNKMKTALMALETSWLREWRILLMADFLEDSSLVKEIQNMVEKIVNDDPASEKISHRARWLLKKIAIGSYILSKVEIARATKYVLPNNTELVKKIIQFIFEKLSETISFLTMKRKTLVLILDERLDHVPIEALQILKNQAVTRMPSFHVAYTLFKEFEDSIENGCKIVKVGKNLGSFIVNPSADLEGTEKRLRIFNNYWLPDWKGTYGEAPTQENFEAALVNHDLLMYGGHGSGIQYLPGDQIERLRVKAIVMLFGCSSTELIPMGGRFPPYSISNHYLTARSPCIMGMLWVVTDTDIDRMTVNFLSNWLKSSVERPWSDVDQQAWVSGTLVFNKNSSSTKNIEPEMLRALATSRWACMQFMTSASVVVRGLPIKLVYT